MALRQSGPGPTEAAVTSAFPRFYRLSLSERRDRVLEHTELTPAEANRLRPVAGLSEEDADRMVENAVGVFGLPLGPVRQPDAGRPRRDRADGGGGALRDRRLLVRIEVATRRRGHHK